MSDPVSVRRQLKIKTGVVNRLLKENGMYRKETEAQKLKVDKLVADGASGGEDSEWNIKNGRKMLEESENMINDTGDRLGKAVLDLRDLIAAVTDDSAIVESEEFKNAESTLELASV